MLRQTSFNYDAERARGICFFLVHRMATEGVESPPRASLHDDAVRRLSIDMAEMKAAISGLTAIISSDGARSRVVDEDSTLLSRAMVPEHEHETSLRSPFAPRNSSLVRKSSCESVPELPSDYLPTDVLHATPPSTSHRASEVEEEQAILPASSLTSTRTAVGFSLCSSRRASSQSVSSIAGAPGSSSSPKAVTLGRRTSSDSANTLSRRGSTNSAACFSKKAFGVSSTSGGTPRAAASCTACSYGDELEQEERLEGIVEEFLDSLGVSSPDGAFAASTIRKKSVFNLPSSTDLAARRTGSNLYARRASRAPGTAPPRRPGVGAASATTPTKSMLRVLCEASTRLVPVLRSNHACLKIWDTLTLLCVVYLASVLPVYVGWRESLTSTPSAWDRMPAIHVCMDAVAITDVLLSMRRGFWHDGREVHEPYRVALRYMRADCAIDALAALPVLSVAHTLPEHALGTTLLMLLVELRVVLRLLRRKERRKKTVHRNPVVRRLFELLLLLLLMCHWVGCMWWAVSTNETTHEAEHVADLSDGSSADTAAAAAAAALLAERPSWRPSAYILAQPWVLQWGHACVWGASIVTGFILYDVAPSTGAEVVVTAIALVMGLTMNTVIISSTTSLLQAIDSRNAFGRQRLENIGKYLEFKNVRPELAANIVDFFAYKLTSSAVSLQDVDFNELPSDLSMHLTLELHKSLLKKCFIFSALPPRLLVPLLRKLQPMVSIPGEVIVREGHVNEKLFFIHRGTVQVFNNYDAEDYRDQRLLATLEDNDFFGEASLIPDDDESASRLSGAGLKKGGKANATIVCFSYCEFLTLSRQQLSSLLKSAGGDSHSQLFRTAIMDGVQMRAANTARQQPPSGRRGTSFGVRERSKSVVRRPSKEEEDTAPTPTSTQGKSKTSRRLSLTDRLKRSPRVNVKVPSNSAMTQEANRADQVPA